MKTCYNKTTKGAIFMSEMDRIIREVNSTMAMEGLPLTVEDQERIRTYLTDPSTLEDMIQKLVQQYAVDIVS